MSVHALERCCLHTLYLTHCVRRYVTKDTNDDCKSTLEQILERMYLETTPHKRKILAAQRKRAAATDTAAMDNATVLSPPTSATPASVATSATVRPPA